MQATIYQINSSPGGVPKRPIPTAEINKLGIIGDDHRDKKHHGGINGALCLYSLERIQGLQVEGHAIYPGAIGENITVSGLDWSQMLPGIQLQLGETVQIEITGFATPCTNIEGCFADKNMNRVSHKKYPGWSRVYARVLQTGRIHVGDSVKRLEIGE